MINCNGKKAAYIDDNKLMLNIIKSKLEKFGFKIDVGESVADLYKLMEHNQYDILILDDMMPEVSGTDAMQKLKSDGYNKPIVVLTGNDSFEDRRRYLKYGFDEYIAKPPKDEELDRVFNVFF